MKFNRNIPTLSITFVQKENDRYAVQEKLKSLDSFLSTVEKSAFRMADIATRNPDDALDIVQDAMIKLVENYSAKPTNEWRPLFYAILNSRIIDYQRKKTLTDRIFAWIDAKKNDEEPELESIASEPLALLEEQFTIEQLELALEGLPTRQQQVFMLRTWQGFSVGETAEILDCSEGSVKTHLSRATQTLIQSINAGNKS